LAGPSGRFAFAVSRAHVQNPPSIDKTELQVASFRPPGFDCTQTQ